MSSLDRATSLPTACGAACSEVIALILSPHATAIRMRLAQSRQLGRSSFGIGRILGEEPGVSARPRRASKRAVPQDLLSNASTLCRHLAQQSVGDDSQLDF
jgi:hypothetical protein